MKSNKSSGTATSLASSDALLKLAKSAPVATHHRGRKSRLDSCADTIKELRSKNYSAKQVLEWLKANNGPQLKSVVTFYHWEKNQKKREESKTTV